MTHVPSGQDLQLEQGIGIGERRDSRTHISAKDAVVELRVSAPG